MASADRCGADDWVEVSYTLLEVADRSTNLPEETASKPLIAWVKGFALSGAAIGEQLTVRTLTGREVTGQLTDVLPGYTHTFGSPPAELVHIGRDLRDRVDAYRTGGE
jgi:2-amino-4-ketopentanoate thiolase alpha subunit